MAKFYVWDPDSSERDDAKSYEMHDARGAARAHAGRLFGEESFETITLHVEDADKVVTEVMIDVDSEPVFVVMSMVAL